MALSDDERRELAIRFDAVWRDLEGKPCEVFGGAQYERIGKAWLIAEREQLAATGERVNPAIFIVRSVRFGTGGAN
jgi:hypothetical protein